MKGRSPSRFRKERSFFPRMKSPLTSSASARMHSALDILLPGGAPAAGQPRERESGESRSEPKQTDTRSMFCGSLMQFSYIAQKKFVSIPTVFLKLRPLT